MPQSLSFEAAATLSHACQVAWSLLVTHGGLSTTRRGTQQKVCLLGGGAGAVERTMVQLAKAYVSSVYFFVWYYMSWHLLFKQSWFVMIQIC